MIDFSGSVSHVLHGDNLEVLPKLPDSSFQVVYIDPPFNTGGTQRRLTYRAVADEAGDKVGYRGGRYSREEVGRLGYLDAYDDYLAFISPRLEEARRLLTESGTLYFHIDYREAHYCKVLLDQVFGRDCFLNEVIWAYDYGGRAKDRWPAKHDTILVYVKTPGAHYFDQDAIERIPYMAPDLVSAEKAARGKLPTDVWWHTIVPTSGREKTGYPNQKPEGILRRVLQPSSREGDWVLDFFAGSGTTGAVAGAMGRRFVLVDSNDDAIDVMRRRLAPYDVAFSELT
ncbi:MAG TPA: DNA methyltransferase [Nocardioidaceae bacterium]|nr:DNA methyltransferase [Nocardioidaceae bacterium]